MSDAQYVNGLQLSWGSLKLKIDGEPYTGVSSVGYADALEVSYSYGMGRHHAPRGRSAGKYTPDPLTMTVSKATAQAIRDQLAALSPSGTSYGRAVVPIVLQYIEPDDTDITVEFDDCRLVKCTASNEESADALNEDLEFSVMRIRRNGTALYDESEG